MPNVQKLPQLKQPQPARRGSRRLRMILIIFFVTLLAILFFKSSITKINSIEISGTYYVTASEIGQASRIKIGDHFFAVSSKTINKRIKQIQAIKSVKVTKRFPGELHIRVIEHKVVAFQVSADGIKTVLLANGTRIPITDKTAIVNKPILTGWADNNPLTLKLCAVLDKIPAEMLADISEIKPDPSAVYPDKIKIYTLSQFEVSTTIGYLPDKIEYMRAIIAEEEPGFLTMLEANYRTPYEKVEAPQNVQ